jgi:protein-S-isoprenylcysteine O-methyltransferase Ste14
MYVGLLMLLIAWAVHLVNPASLIGLVAFVWYLSRYQIAPEEKALEANFGSRFQEYRLKVRRWL